MPLIFSANLSTMYREYSFLERFSRAKENGFNVIELQSPYEYSPADISRAMDGLKCDLINSPDFSSFGAASDPLKGQEFADSFQQIIPYYNAFPFKKLHLLAGCKQEAFSYEDQLFQYKESLRSLIESDFLENRNLIAVIEPICPDVKSDYFLNDFDVAVEVIKEINSNQIRLLLDVYHLHKIMGNVKENFEKYYEFSGHIQISQDPERREPFHPDGVIDYNWVFDFLEKKNHSEAIGLEYIPSGRTEDSLEWMKKYTAE